MYRTVRIAGLIILLWASVVRAACTFHTAYTGSDGWSNSTTQTLHMPTGTVASAGDVCVATITGNGEPWALTQPSGFTKAYCSSVSGSETVCFYTYIALGAGSDPITVSGTTSGANYGGGEIECASGCNTTTPVDSGTTTSNSCFDNTTSNLGCTVPAATLANAGDLAIAAEVLNNGDGGCSGTATFTATGGWTARTACAGGGTAVGVTFGWTASFDQAFASAGTTGTFAAAGSGFATAHNAEAMIAIAPAVVATRGTSLKGSAVLKGKNEIQ